MRSSPAVLYLGGQDRDTERGFADNVGGSANSTAAISSTNTRSGASSAVLRSDRWPKGSIMAALVVAGLSAAIATSHVWPDLRREAPHAELASSLLAASTVLLALLAAWISGLRSNIDGDLLSSRLVISTPCLVWASTSVLDASSSFGSDATSLPSALQVGCGIVATGMFAADVLSRAKPVIVPILGRIIAAGLSISLLAAALQWGMDPESANNARQLATAKGFPAAWFVLGVITALSARRTERNLRRNVGLFLVLLSAAQIVASYRLEAPLSPAGHDVGGVLASLLGCIAAAVLVAGLSSDLRDCFDRLRSRRVGAEVDAAQMVDRLRAEQLLASRRAHDQKAGLLSVETVIHLLQSDSSSLDPVAKQRLCAAATEELRRLRGVPSSEQSGVERFDIGLNETLEPVIALAKAAGANVEMCIRPSLVVQGDPAAIVDVVRNLISNAVHHGNNCSIRVSAIRSDYDFVELSVSDGGPGIASARRFDLFEPGRSSGGPDRSGLGLHSARTLLRDMGGDLILDRTYQGGARFVATLPVSKSLAADSQRRATLIGP
jgi:signal transduction histidine kinase